MAIPIFSLSESAAGTQSCSQVRSRFVAWRSTPERRFQFAHRVIRAAGGDARCANRGLFWRVWASTCRFQKAAPDIRNKAHAHAGCRTRGQPAPPRKHRHGFGTPPLLRRVNITQDRLTTFSARSIQVSDGSISFYDPVKIAPVLDIDLTTKAQKSRLRSRSPGPSMASHAHAEFRFFAELQRHHFAADHQKAAGIRSRAAFRPRTRLFPERFSKWVHRRCWARRLQRRLPDVCSASSA